MVLVILRGGCLLMEAGGPDVGQGVRKKARFERRGRGERGRREKKGLSSRGITIEKEIEIEKRKKRVGGGGESSDKESENHSKE